MPTQLITAPNIIIKVLYFCVKFTQKTHWLNTKKKHTYTQKRVYLSQTIIEFNKHSLETNYNQIIMVQKKDIRLQKKLNNTRENYKANTWFFFFGCCSPSFC